MAKMLAATIIVLLIALFYAFGKALNGFDQYEDDDEE